MNKSNENKINQLISVIVPIYNTDIFLDRCISSIINQTYKNLEIILIDDGSTDSSATICDKYKKIDSRIVVIHKDNKGLSSARNVGLDVAKGDLIGFVDSDDYILENMYEELLTSMVENCSDVAVCDVNFIGRTINKNYKSNDFVSFGKEKFENLENNYEFLTTVAWNKLYNKNVFNNIRYPDGKIYEDRYIICYLLNNINRISYHLIPLYNYQNRDNSISNEINLKKLDWVDAYNNCINYYKEKNYDDLEYSLTIKKCNLLLYYFPKLVSNGMIKIKKIKEYNNYYNDLLQSTKNIHWKDSNRHIKMFKIFGILYIISKSLMYKIYGLFTIN